MIEIGFFAALLLLIGVPLLLVYSIIKINTRKPPEPPDPLTSFRAKIYQKELEKQRQKEK